MEPANGHPCPECGAPRQQDGTPSCSCTHRAAEALRDARTARAAAAEDFDPLRIRPYVEIDGAAPSGPDPQVPEDGGAPRPHPRPAPGDAPAAPPGASSAADGSGPPPSPHAAVAPSRAGLPRPERPTPPADGAPRQRSADPAQASRAEGTAPANGGASRQARGDSPATPPHAETSHPGGSAQPPSPASATMTLRPVDPDATTVLPASPATSALPTPPAPGNTVPSVTRLHHFDGTRGTVSGMPEHGAGGARGSGRRRRTLLLAAAAAGVAVVAAAGYASGLFSYESPARDTALPDDIRASVPDAPSSGAASTPPEGTAPAAPPAPAAPRPSRTSSPSPSPSPSASSASPSPSQSVTPSAPQTSATATGPGQAPPDSARQNGGPNVLRLGDRGPEVSELQLRLRQLYLYDEDADGLYAGSLEEAVRNYQWSRGIRTEDLGVYDQETRAKLESETREP